MVALSESTPHRQAFARLKEELDARRPRALVTPLTADDPSLMPSGLLALDGALGGGFTRGVVATLEGAGSSGRMAVAARLLATVTRRTLAAVVDDGALFPPDLVRAGVVLERLVVVPAPAALGMARAVDILLRAAAFGIVVMPAVRVRAAVWARLAGLAHHANALLLVVGDAPNELGFTASTRVRCAIERVLWAHSSGIFNELAGYHVRLDVIKNKRAAPGTHARIHIGAVA